MEEILRKANNIILAIENDILDHQKFEDRKFVERFLNSNQELLNIDPVIYASLLGFTLNRNLI